MVSYCYQFKSHMLRPLLFGPKVSGQTHCPPLLPTCLRVWSVWLPISLSAYGSWGAFAHGSTFSLDWLSSQLLLLPTPSRPSKVFLGWNVCVCVCVLQIFLECLTTILARDLPYPLWSILKVKKLIISSQAIWLICDRVTRVTISLSASPCSAK